MENEGEETKNEDCDLSDGGETMLYELHDIFDRVQDVSERLREVREGSHDLFEAPQGMIYEFKGPPDEIPGGLTRISSQVSYELTLVDALALRAHGLAARGHLPRVVFGSRV